MNARRIGDICLSWFCITAE